MIYGYSRRNKLNKHGLREMRQVSIAASPAALRDLAAFLVATADKIETEEMHFNWHRQVDESLEQALGCDFVVTVSDA